MGQHQIWHSVPETNGFYQLSLDGRVRKIDKSLLKYGIHIYKSEVFKVVNHEIVRRKYLHKTFSVPCLRLKCLEDTGNMVPISVLMYKVFHGVSNILAKEIIHLDGDEENNHLGNLILGTSSLKLEYLSIFYSDHIDPNLRKIRDVVSACFFEKISKYNMKGNLVKVYDNLKKASLGEDLSTVILVKHIEGQHIFPSDGNYYLRGHGPELLDFSLIENQELSEPNFRKQKNKSIFLRYYIDGSLKAVYSTIEEASNQTFCSKSRINLSIKTRSFVDDYLWVQLFEGSLVDSAVKQESYALQ